VKSQFSGLILAALAATAGCKKSDEAKQGEAPPPAEAAGKTATEAATPAVPNEVAGADLVKRIDACYAALEAWEKDAVRDCFSKTPEVIYIDQVPPTKATTPEQIVVQAGSFRNAFPDFKAERLVILVKGTKSAVLVRNTGTHKGSSLGIPPTGKSLSILTADVGEHDPDGRNARARYYVDQSTILHQLGVQESASAAASEKSWGEPVRVVAKGDDAERANLEVVRSGLDALTKADVKSALAMYANDAVLRYIPDANPYTGLQDIESWMRGYIAVSVDYAMTTRDAWAAGDWVVAELTTGGKLAQDLPDAKGTKGKKWELNTLELFRLADGKVKQHWSFANGLKFAADVGLFDPSILVPSGDQ
jgi:ketosteroid isomerase-like protein